MRQTNERGFSLVELLIVVAIIGIIAAIAIPNLLASRRASNEGSAQSSMRTINSAEVAYNATAGQGTYGSLAQLQTANLVDAVLGPAIDAANAKSGYYFTVNPIPPVAGTASAQYWAFALPAVPGGFSQTGTRRFGIAEDGVLRGDTTLAAPADYTEVNPGMAPLGN